MQCSHCRVHLDSVDAVWDEAEIVAPHQFLCAVEHRMVGAHQLQHAASQALLQRSLVLPGEASIKQAQRAGSS